MTAKNRKPSAGAETTAVVLAYPWTDGDGNSHDPDSTVTVDKSTGRTLVRDGLARLPEPNTKAEE